MDVISTGLAAYNTIASLKKQLDTLDASPEGVGNAVLGAANRANELALSQAIKDALITSTIYYEDTLANEPLLMGNLLATIHQIYAAYVITVMGLNTEVGDCKVRDMLRKVSTEECISGVELADLCQQRYLDEVPVRVAVEDAGNRITDLSSDNFRQASGKAVEITFYLKNKVEVKATVFVQLQPSAMTSSVARMLITYNFPDSIWQRFKKWKLGLTRSIADFLFGINELKSLDKALREDRSHQLLGAIDQRHNALAKAWLAVANIRPNNNTATTVLFITKSSFDQACSDASLNFRIPADRDRFFRKSMMFMVVVIDSDYSMIDLFTFGLKQYGSYPFTALEKSGGKGQSLDLKTLMALLAQGNTPHL